ncbi:MAG: metal-sensitive transcriptional regulator [Solirubrobacterales bacterium]|nr:metal-sensitive transcriptional regulator [Solirubrobacterales bacterium]
MVLASGHLHILPRVARTPTPCRTKIVAGARFTGPSRMTGKLVPSTHRGGRSVMQHLAARTPGDAALVRRMHRVEGQARGLTSMLEAGRPTPELLTQIAAIRGALREVACAIVAGDARRIAGTGDGTAVDALVESVEQLARQ